MFKNLFKENFIYRMAESATSTSTVTKPSEEDKTKLKEKILNRGAIFFSDPNNPKKKRYAGDGSLGITTILSANTKLRNPFSRATDELKDFYIEETDHGITIHRKNTGKELQINFTAVKEAVSKDKTKPFTTKIKDEKYPGQSIEYTSSSDGSKSVKIVGENMTINFDDPAVDPKLKRMKNLIIKEEEYREKPNAYLSPPPDSKVMIECDFHQQDRIKSIYKDLEINGIKVKDIPADQFVIRDRSGGISAGVRNEVHDVGNSLRGANLSGSTSTAVESTPPDTRPRSASLKT